MRKAFVKVKAEFDREGNVVPISLQWEDGRVFEVDRVLEVMPAASGAVGGNGLRYTCRIQNRPKFLYLDRTMNRWYVEAK